MANDLFKDRKLVIATMHGKELVIAPALERELGVKVVIPTGFDTDKYGTFARDVKRSGNQLEAARLKVRAAMEMTGADLGVASEGSFGAHPLIPFVQSDFELIVLIDAKNEYEICGHYRTAETNIEGRYISSVDEALAFAKKIGFPEHGIILKKEEDGRGWVDKTIRTQDELISAVTRRLSGFFTKKIFIETDMRADKNPTRMLAIEKATIDLIKNIYSKCPKCMAPGFVCIGFEKGLRCSLCGSPTDLPMADIFQCKTCSYEEKRPALGFESSAEPRYCQYCNP